MSNPMCEFYVCVCDQIVGLCVSMSPICKSCVSMNHIRVLNELIYVLILCTLVYEPYRSVLIVT